MSIITYPLNGVDYTADDAETYLCTRVSGVFASDGHFDASVTGDREITIGTGLAWIQNTDHCGKSVYNDMQVTVTVPIADGTWDRIDRIVLRFSKEANASEIVIKEGTPSSVPKAPDVTRTEVTYELGLYMIEVAASSVAISEAAITDTRMDEDVCGLMRDGVTGIPTAQLQEQYEALIADLKEEIRDIEAGSDVMLKAIYDPVDGERQVAFKDELVDTLYPVGSIYISVNSANPATFFGGEWNQIEDTFLLAAGAEYAGGSTGGAATVALSSSEMPSHTHSLPSHTHSLPSHTHSLPSHTHSLPSHTHSTPSHTHSIPALSGTAASAGAHQHKGLMEAKMTSGSSNAIYSDGSSTTGSYITNSAGAHTHTVTTSASTTGSSSGTSGSTSGTSGSTSGTSGSTSGTSGSTSGTSGSTGSGSAHNNMPPYLAVYMWERVA